MLKKLAKFLIRRYLLGVLFRIHSFIYVIIGNALVDERTGSHPKHKILKYSDWYTSQTKSNWTVLDIGSGRGLLGYQLAQHGRRVIGIEIEKKNFEIAMKLFNSPNLTWHHSDALTFDYGSLGFVNAVILSNVLEHIENRVVFLTTLAKSIKWASENRVFLIRVPTIERDWLSVFRREQGYEWRLDKTHFTEYTERELRQELANSGLKIVSFERRFDEFFVQATAEQV